MRFCATSPLPALPVLIGIGGAFAQSGTPNPQDQAKAEPRQADATPTRAKDNQRKTDEFVEAAQAINGPAGNPECVWLGRRVVRLMWSDDLDTAFRHLDLYDRFGCPGGHVQADVPLPDPVRRDRSTTRCRGASTAASTPAGSILGAAAGPRPPQRRARRLRDRRQCGARAGSLALRRAAASASTGAGVEITPASKIRCRNGPRFSRRWNRLKRRP